MPTGLSSQLSIDAMRLAAEQSLFFFSRNILERKWLTTSLHQSMCSYLQIGSKTRKLMLVPRNHGKTTLIKDQILHLLIQPASHNIYFSGFAGSDLRILLASETTRNAARHLRSIEAVLEKNRLLRSLWPHIARGAKWSETEMELQRSTNYSEPTVEALGTDTAIASRHVDWIFCDDIYTFEAMQSPSVSERVNLWYDALEPILDVDENHEARLTVTGTAWSDRDVYKRILDSIAEGDSSYEEPYIRSVIENGQPIWPERFPLSRLENIRFRTERRGLWAFNWMNSYGQSELTDFRRSWLQSFALEGDIIVRADSKRILLSQCDIVTCYDPARTRASEYKHLARNAIMTTACDAEYNVYILAYYAARASLRDIFNALVSQCERFSPRCIGIEDVATQVAIGDAFDIIAELEGVRLAPLVELRPDTSVNKKWRIKTEIQHIASYNRLYMQADQYEFCSEYDSFPNGRTVDILDVLAYCISLHNIPSTSLSKDYNQKLRNRIQQSWGIAYGPEDSELYAIAGPPEDLPRKGVMRVS